MNEREIVAGCKRGDPAAARLMAESFYDRVFRVACALIKDPHRAEDLTQETFTASLKSIHAFRGESGLFTWLVAILRRQWLYRSRDQNRLKIVDELDAGPAPAEDTERRHAREELKAAFDRLQEEDRAILTLFHVEGVKYAQIAEILEVPIGTVKSRLHEARRRLKRLIDGSHAV